MWSARFQVFSLHIISMITHKNSFSLSLSPKDTYIWLIERSHLVAIFTKDLQVEEKQGLAPTGRLR